MKAAIAEAITILSYHYIGGSRILETSCADYQQYSSLPAVVTYQGRLYGKTGWSSDTGKACYRDDVKMAIAH